MRTLRRNGHALPYSEREIGKIVNALGAELNEDRVMYDQVKVHPPYESVMRKGIVQCAVEDLRGRTEMRFHRGASGVDEIRVQGPLSATVAEHLHGLTGYRL